MRTHLTSAFALLIGVAASISVVDRSPAADFPTKTVRIVIPFSAGGAPDVLLRMVVPHLSEKWKQPVVVENRPGANTNLGTVVVTKADADGHTLLFTTDGTFIFNPLIYSSMPYAVSSSRRCPWWQRHRRCLRWARTCPRRQFPNSSRSRNRSPGAELRSTGPPACSVCRWSISRC